MKNYDSLFNNNCNKPNPRTCGCEVVNGNAVEVQLQHDDCEVRADVIVGKSSSVRIWGQVRDCNGAPVANALVKLVKVVYHCGQLEFLGVAHSLSDCTGFYQFDVDPCEVGTKYRVLVHKAAAGTERVVPPSAELCKPCNEHNEPYPQQHHCQTPVQPRYSQYSE